MHGNAVMNPDGTGLAFITEDGGAPVWSPGGRQIVLVVARGMRGELDLAVVNADGSGFQRITSNRWLNANVSWQPE
jgi:Tol biopolymer transport system component